MDLDITVRNNVEAGCYDALLDDRVVGMIVYERRDNRVIFRHTIVEPELRGHGVATALARGALDDVAASGRRLTNYCGFITDFIAINPAYRGLLDADLPGHPRAREGALNSARDDTVGHAVGTPDNQVK
jgi:hypothetical protein